MSTVSRCLLLRQEYLAKERSASFRSEFLPGEMFAMAGGSPRHSLIKANLVAELRNRLRAKGLVVSFPKWICNHVLNWVESF